MSLLSKLKGTGPSGFGYGSTATEVTAGLDLTGQNVLLTGCTSGLGKETLRVLALRGAQVFGAGRTLARAEAACEAAPGHVQPVACDLSDPTSVRACADSLKRQNVELDVIVCNAGIMALPSLQQAYGYELQFFTNHVGHFILVTELLKQLSPQGRVVVVSSAAHAAAPRSKGIDFDNLSGDVDYRPWTAYGQSKLANLLFASELSRRLPQPNQTANSLHPGVIRTNLVRNLPTIVQLGATLIAPLGWKTIEQGAATQCYLASQPTLTTSGNYYADCNVATSSPFGRDTALAARLWEVSEGIVSGL